jgi:hypothetical protein
MENYLKIIILSCLVSISAFGKLPKNERNFNVEIEFHKKDLSYVLRATELRMVKTRCSSRFMSHRQGKWSCEIKSHGNYTCNADFQCRKLRSKSYLEKRITSLEKQIGNQLGKKKFKNKIKIKLTKILAKKQNKKAVSHNSLLRKRRGLLSKFKPNHFNLSTVRVWENKSSTLITTHLGWNPRFDLSQKAGIIGKLGGHYLSSESTKSFLVLEHGLFIEYNFDYFSTEIGTGTQIWNTDDQGAIDFYGIGLSVYPERKILSHIDKLTISYTQSSGEKSVNDIRVGAGFNF